MLAAGGADDVDGAGGVAGDDAAARDVARALRRCCLSGRLAAQRYQERHKGGVGRGGYHVAVWGERRGKFLIGERPCAAAEKGRRRRKKGHITRKLENG